jgi:V/A-type H+-transporting ATPase subunit D
VHVLPRSSIGVEYPAVTAEAMPLQPVGLLWTDASFDATRASLVQSAMLLAKQGEAETALWRLLAEQRKTQKRVNALKYNIIPRYTATIRYIESALEEEERNTLFQIKVLRDRKPETPT